MPVLMNLERKREPMTDEDYEVGYGKPPKSTQFKPGQSGNSKGRPKGSKNFVTDFQEELNEKVPVRENGKIKKLTKQRAILKAQVSKAMAGDARAAQIVVNMMSQYFEAETQEPDNLPPGPSDEEILQMFEGHQNEVSKNDT